MPEGGGGVVGIANVYKGTWNALANVPVLGNGGAGGVLGEYFVIGVAGTTSIDGISAWDEGDWIINNGTIWQKVDNTDAVISVAGRQGSVVLASADIVGFQTSVSGNADVTANTAARHGHTNKTTIDVITDAGSGAIITSAERTGIGLNTAARHGHTNKATIDAITNAGSGDIITSGERTDIGLNNAARHGHTNKVTIDAITDAGSGAIITAQERTDIGSANNHGASTSNPHSTTAAQVWAVALTGDEVIDGKKTFSTFPETPTAAPTTDYQAANKKYVDDSIVMAEQIEYAENDGVSATTATVYQEKLKLSFTANFNGDYLIIWSGEVSTSINNKAVKVRVQLDDTTTISEPVETTYTTDFENKYFTLSEIKKVTLTAGAHFIDIDWSGDVGTNTARIKNARIFARSL